MKNANVSPSKCCRLMIALAIALPLLAQLPGLPTTGQLNDAQAMAMMQAIAAQAQNPAAPAITQAQVQLLLQYMTKASAASPASAAQAQMMMQALAQSQAAAPAAALSAAQAQSLARMLSAQGMAGMPAMGMQNIGAGRMAMPGQQPTGLAPTGLAPTIVSTQPAALAPKKPGTIRIGVVEPRAQIAQGGQGANIAEPVRGLVMRYLNGPMLEVIPLVALLPQQAEAEAAQKECDYILATAVTQKLDAGKFSMLRKAAPMANMIPMVSMASMAGAAAGAASAAAASTAASVASGVKAKAEITFEYRLAVPGSASAVLANTATAKAKSDGDDVITPLVEQADGAIFAAVTKK